MKYTWAFITALIVGLYTAFVTMCMWNWFAVRALNVSPLSYFEVLGLVWLIALLTNRSDNDEVKWERVYIILNACVPDNKREMLKEELQTQAENYWPLISQIVGQVIGNTITLILGFLLHIYVG